MKLRYTRRAVSDIEAINDYIRAHSSTGAARVVDALERSLELLLSSPHLGADRPDLGVRKLGIPRFP